MGRRVAMLVAVVAAAGCGGVHERAHTASTSAPRTATAAPAPPVVRVGVVGPLQVQAAGAQIDRGPLAQVAGDPLVLVWAPTADTAAVIAAADDHPSGHFALVGASTTGFRRRNLAGIVIREDQAARLAGAVAGLAATDAGASAPVVAWVGPEERHLAASFAVGLRGTAPGGTVLRAWSRDQAAACKEAALGAIDEGAQLVVAHRGLCAQAAAVGAHERNRIALDVSSFEEPTVAADRIAQDAVSGIYYGGEDLVFGASTGAIVVGRLDPRISSTTVLRAHTAAQQLAAGQAPTG